MSDGGKLPVAELAAILLADCDGRKVETDVVTLLVMIYEVGAGLSTMLPDQPDVPPCLPKCLHLLCCTEMFEKQEARKRSVAALGERVAGPTAVSANCAYGRRTGA